MIVCNIIEEFIKFTLCKGMYTENFLQGIEWGQCIIFEHFHQNHREILLKKIVLKDKKNKDYS